MLPSVDGPASGTTHTSSRVRYRSVEYDYQVPVCRVRTKMHACKQVSVFYEEGNALNTFVRPKGCTQYILVRNTERKHNCFCLQENSTGSFKCAATVYLHLFVQAGNKQPVFRSED